MLEGGGEAGAAGAGATGFSPGIAALETGLGGTDCVGGEAERGERGETFATFLLLDLEDPRANPFG